MKRTLWSILTAAAAAVLPGMTGPAGVADIAASLPEASARPSAEALEVRKPEIRHDLRQLDDVDDDPAPTDEYVAVEPVHVARTAPASILAPPSTPDLTPLARRSLGRPRVRAPDQTV